MRRPRCCVRTRCDHSWRERPGSVVISRLPRAALADGPASVCAHLQRHGYAIVPLSAEILSAGAEVERRFRAFFAGSNAEKSRFRTPQEGERVLSHPGYLTPSPGWCELFEVRRSCRDPAYRMPPGTEDAAMRLFDGLRALAVEWLGLISAHVYVSRSRVTNDLGVVDL